MQELVTAANEPLQEQITSLRKMVESERVLLLEEFQTVLVLKEHSLFTLHLLITLMLLEQVNQEEQNFITFVNLQVKQQKLKQQNQTIINIKRTRKGVFLLSIKHDIGLQQKM